MGDTKRVGYIDVTIRFTVKEEADGRLKAYNSDGMCELVAMDTEDAMQDLKDIVSDGLCMGVDDVTFTEDKE